MVWSLTLSRFCQKSHRVLLYRATAIKFSSLYKLSLSDVVSDTLSCLNLFADDVLLYHAHLHVQPISYASLQEGIELWSTENYLSFLLIYVYECKFMVIARERNPTLPDV